MSNFNGFKKMAKETMETIADRSAELYRIAEEKTKIIARRTKISAEIAVEKGSVRNLYKEIGKVYYALHRDTPEPSLKPLCAEIDEAIERINEKQQELDELKNAVYTADYTAPPVDDETITDESEADMTAAAQTAEPAPPADAYQPDQDTDEAPQSGTYTAPSQSETTPPPSEDWQKKYPPEFRL